MKKRLAYFLAVGLIAWSGLTSYAAADDDDDEDIQWAETDQGVGDDTGSKPEIDETTEEVNPMTGNMGQIDITVKESGDKTDTYRVTMKWTTMEFTYVPTAKIWNADTLTWDNDENDGASAKWFVTGTEEETDEDSEDENEEYTPQVKIAIENRSSKPVKIGFQAGEGDEIEERINIESETPYEIEGEETGITLSAEGDDTVEAATAAVLSEDGDSAEVEGAPGKSDYTITVGGEPKRDSETEGDFAISIPMTVIVTPILED